jgi:hypothetical protein
MSSRELICWIFVHAINGGSPNITADNELDLDVLCKKFKCIEFGRVISDFFTH